MSISRWRRRMAGVATAAARTRARSRSVWSTAPSAASSASGTTTTSSGASTSRAPTQFFSTHSTSTTTHLARRDLITPVLGAAKCAALIERAPIQAIPYRGTTERERALHANAEPLSPAEGGGTMVTINFDAAALADVERPVMQRDRQGVLIDPP